MEKQIVIRLTTLCSILVLLNSCNQQLYYSLEEVDPHKRNEITAHGILIAEKILLEDCRKDRNRKKYWDGTYSEPRKQFGIYEVDSLTIVPIALFQISNDAEQYNGKGIAGYLKWSKKDLVGFYSFKDGVFEGLLDWSGEHHYNLTKECSYFTVHNSNWTIKNSYWMGYKYLKERDLDFSFLFGVKYFVETLWFVENEKIFVLNLNEMKIYDPDDFIRSQCDDGFIHESANGSKITCNH